MTDKELAAAQAKDAADAKAKADATRAAEAKPPAPPPPPPGTPAIPPIDPAALHAILGQVATAAQVSLLQQAEKKNLDTAPKGGRYINDSGVLVDAWGRVVEDESKPNPPPPATNF